MSYPRTLSSVHTLHNAARTASLASVKSSRQTVLSSSRINPLSSTSPSPSSLTTTRHFSAAPPSMAASAVTLSDAIKQDHRDLEEAYNRILSANTDDEKVRWQNQFTWELARHSIGEELVVYPQFEKKLPNGKQMADKDRKEHLAVKEHLYKFQKLKPKDPEFEPTLKSLWSDLIEHIKEEEEQDMPALEKALDQSTSAELKGSFVRTKKFLPTRSHPNAPDKPPFETVAGLMAAPIDHLMDVFKKFPKESKSELPP